MEFHWYHRTATRLPRGSKKSDCPAVHSRACVVHCPWRRRWMWGMGTGPKRGKNGKEQQKSHPGWDLNNPEHASSGSPDLLRRTETNSWVFPNGFTRFYWPNPSIQGLSLSRNPRVVSMTSQIRVLTPASVSLPRQSWGSVQKGSQTKRPWNCWDFRWFSMIWYDLIWFHWFDQSQFLIISTLAVLNSKARNMRRSGVRVDESIAESWWQAPMTIWALHLTKHSYLIIFVDIISVGITWYSLL